MKKTDHRTEAHRLYVGRYFKAMLAYAESKAALEDIYIVSAKYGIVSSLDEIDPYEQRLGQPGAIALPQIREQAQSWDLIRSINRTVRCPLIVLGGRKYVELIRSVFPAAEAPLQDNGIIGIGRQISYLLAESRR